MENITRKMVNKIVWSSVKKIIGQSAFADMLSLILPMADTKSPIICTKRDGTISMSTGVKYVLIMVKLNKNKLSKFIEFRVPRQTVSLRCQKWRKKFGYVLEGFRWIFLYFTRKTQQRKTMMKWICVLFCSLSNQMFVCIHWLSVIFDEIIYEMFVSIVSVIIRWWINFFSPFQQQSGEQHTNATDDSSRCDTIHCFFFISH